MRTSSGSAEMRPGTASSLYTLYHSHKSFRNPPQFLGPVLIPRRAATWRPTRGERLDRLEHSGLKLIQGICRNPKHISRCLHPSGHFSFLSVTEERHRSCSSTVSRRGSGSEGEEEPLVIWVLQTELDLPIIQSAARSKMCRTRNQDIHQ